MKKIFLSCYAITLALLTNAQIINIDVNLNVNHIIDTVTTFHREKFVTMHADPLEPEWDAGWGANFTSDVRNDFLNGYDVYLGRDTGPATTAVREALEDDNRTGYPDTASIASNGASFRSWYGSNTNFHPYESRGDIIACAQLHPFWPDGATTNSGWALSQEDTEGHPFGTASGEVMAHYLKHYYGAGGTDGQPKPKYVEIINEPMYELVDWKHLNQPMEIFKFHKSVATQVKRVNPDIKIGGYCTAFPDFDKNNFQQWEQRWKTFMDFAGDNMDFWTIHMYDFPTFGGEEHYRKGSNMEATLDMMEQYSLLSCGEVKEFLVSEFGASVHDYQGAWRPYRDWLHMKSINSMMLQFMERPNNIIKIINFLIIKATWGTSDVNNTYPHRLLRKADEPDSYTGNWVYTDMVKTFQLWSDVKGKRVDSYATDVDILTDAFVDGNKAYVILNNLDFADKTIQLNIAEDDALTINSLHVKQLYLGDSHPIKDWNVPVLDDRNYTDNFPTEYTLKPEGTIILEYTFSGNINIDEQSTETKHYANTYYKPITADADNTFTINGISKGSNGEAVLRIGIGRSHSLTLIPTVRVNGTDIDVPHDFRGGPQTDRDSFFGVLEVPVPYDILQENNVVNVKFPDSNGFISTVTLQHFIFSRAIVRSNPSAISDKQQLNMQSVRLYPNPAGNRVIVGSNNNYTRACFYNVSGSKYLTSELKNDAIDIRNIPEGIYMVELTNAKQRAISKLVIQR